MILALYTMTIQSKSIFSQMAANYLELFWLEFCQIKQNFPFYYIVLLQEIRQFQYAKFALKKVKTEVTLATILNGR